MDLTSLALWKSLVFASLSNFLPASLPPKRPAPAAVVIRLLFSALRSASPPRATPTTPVADQYAIASSWHSSPCEPCATAPRVLSCLVLPCLALPAARRLAGRCALSSMRLTRFSSASQPSRQRPNAASEPTPELSAPAPPLSPESFFPVQDSTTAFPIAGAC